MAGLPTMVGGVQTSRATLISDLNAVVVLAYPDFVKKYGNENYVYVTEMMGKKIKSENKSFYHYENRGKLHGFVTCNAPVVSGGAGQAISVTLSAGDHFNGGAEDPTRVGEVVFNSRTGLQAKISAVNVQTPGAHAILLTPLRSTDAFSVLAGDQLLFRGLINVGEASSASATQDNLSGRIQNFITEIREDWSITDLAMMERIDFSYNGQNYFKYKGMDESVRRFMNNKEMSLMFGVNADNLGNGTTGSQGLITQVQAGGQTITYNTFSAFDTMNDIGRALDAEGGATEYDWLCDTDQFMDIQKSLATQYNNGAILYVEDNEKSSDEMVIKRDFKSYHINGTRFNFKKYPLFNNRTVYGANQTGTVFDNFGVLIPQDSQVNGEDSESIPSFCIRYQDIPGYGEMKVWEYGAMASTPTSGDSKLTVSHQTFVGAQVFAVNRYLTIFKAA